MCSRATSQLVGRSYNAQREKPPSKHYAVVRYSNSFDSRTRHYKLKYGQSVPGASSNLTTSTNLALLSSMKASPIFILSLSESPEPLCQHRQLMFAATYESKHGTNPHISLPTAVMTRPSNPWTLPGLGLLINSTYAIHDLSLAFNDLDLGSRIPTTYSGTEAGPLSCRNRNRQSRFFCSREAWTDNIFQSINS